MESGLPATTLETVPLVQQGSDPVAFGKHGELTYDELWAKEPGYCHWTIKKFKELVNEGVELELPFQEGDSKMKRLAHWLIEREKQAELNGPAYEYDKNGDLVEIPTSLTLKERVDAAAAEKAPKFYGIAAPEKRVCTSWEECKKYVHGVKGVMYRSFPTREEAEEYVANPPARKIRTAPKKQPKGGGADGEDGGENAKDSVNESCSAAPAKKKRKVKDAATSGDAGADAKAQDEVTTKSKMSKPKATAKAKAKGKAKAKARAKGKVGANSVLAKIKENVKAKIQAHQNRITKLKAQAKAPEKAAGAGKGDDVAKPSAEESKEKPQTKAVNGVKAKVSKVAKETVTKSKKDVTASKETSVPITAEVMQQAESLGLAASLRNLASRPEIVSSKLHGDKLLEALKACDGLVNKAKAALLEPAGPVSTPSRATSQAAPSAEDATPEKEVGEKLGMTEEQRQRIQENRERAFATKQRLLQEQSGGA